MNRIRFLLLLATVALCGCKQKSQDYAGKWKVVNVNMEFDENKYTPDMVRQVGLSEKSNEITIGSDSSMVYVSCGDTLSGKLNLRDGVLYCGNVEFATLRKDTIVETKRTVMGEVKIKYCREWN